MKFWEKNYLHGITKYKQKRLILLQFILPSLTISLVHTLEYCKDVARQESTTILKCSAITMITITKNRAASNKLGSVSALANA